MPFLLLTLAACSDYSVSHSDLTAQSESGEILLAEGEELTLVVRMEADGEAMAASPTSFVELTVFAVQEEGSPRLYVDAAGQAVDSGVAPTAFLELTIESPFAGCEEPSEGTLAATVAGDGTCVVALPVGFALEGGTVSLQLDAYVRLNFASKDPPGELTVSVAPQE